MYIGMGLSQFFQRLLGRSEVGPRKKRSPLRDQSAVEIKQEQAKFDDSWIVEFMQAIKMISKLQREAVTAEVEARQKRREASIKRNNVWMSDVKFMDEMQRLFARGELSASNELTRLAAECQDSRNNLGPVEQEGIDAEQRWEGHIWQLRKAEDWLLTEFHDQFMTAESYSTRPSSAASSQCRSSSEHESRNSTMEEQSGMVLGTGSVASSVSIQLLPQVEDFPSQLNREELQTMMLVDLIGSTPRVGSQEKTEKYPTDCDSGTGNIDKSIHGSSGLPQQLRDRDESPDEFLGPAQPLPDRPYTPLELFPASMTNFSSKRDVINQWLENNMFATHIEGVYLFTALKAQLEAEEKEKPSNWAELVIAFWKLDGGAYPGYRDIALNSVKSTPSETKAATENERHGSTQLLERDAISDRSHEDNMTDHGYLSDEKASRGWGSFAALTDCSHVAPMEETKEEMDDKDGEGNGKDEKGRNGVNKSSLLRPLGGRTGAGKEKSSQEIEEEQRQTKLMEQFSPARRAPPRPRVINAEAKRDQRLQRTAIS